MRLLGLDPGLLSRLRHNALPENRGFSAAVNAGIRRPQFVARNDTS